METRSVIISLLLLTVLASGCADSEGNETGSITVTGLQVQPQSIYEGNSITASLDIANTGNLPASIALGTDKGSINGRNILRNYCPDIFSPSQFSFQPSELADDEGVVKLDPGTELRMQWRLEHTGNPRLINEKCTVEFDLPFNYSVSSYRQVQIKQSSDISGSELRWESSSGPLVFAVETIGSTAEEGQTTYITPGTEEGTPEENVPDSMTVLLQLQNPSGEGYDAGVIDVNEESLEISATEPLELDERFSDGSWVVEGDYSESRCSIDADNDIRIYDGKSRVMRCEVPVPETIDSPGRVSEIRASINYTYLKNAGSREVEVKPRGN